MDFQVVYHFPKFLEKTFIIVVKNSFYFFLVILFERLEFWSKLKQHFIMYIILWISYLNLQKFSLFSSGSFRMKNETCIYLVLILFRVKFCPHIFISFHFIAIFWNCEFLFKPEFQIHLGLWIFLKSNFRILILIKGSKRFTIFMTNLRFILLK